MQNKFLQISSLGSKDKNNLNVSTQVSQDIDTAGAWEASPNHPIVKGFQSLFSAPNTKVIDSPAVQTTLFDADNIVKGESGIYREMQDGLTPFGSDVDGKPLYSFSDVSNNQDFDLGKNKLYTAGSMMQGLGAFADEEEADNFAKFTQNAGDPSFMGAISGLAASGQKKEAVNLIMKEFNYPDLDSIDNHDDKKRAYSTAFAAYNLVENVEKMSPAQQSLSLSTLGLMSYKFKDGTTIKDRALVKGPDGETQMSLSDAFSLGGSGFDVGSMQKNWEQLSAIQNITYGKGTPSQLAATGKRMQLLGDPSMEGAAVYQKDSDLGRLGFKAIPSAGMGAITGNADALPSNYEVVGAGEKQGQVIAVPKGLAYSTSTLNGSAEIRSLNEADGVKKASVGAFKTYARQLPNKSKNDLRGTSIGVGIGQSGILEDPYLRSAVATTSVYGNTVNRSATKSSSGQNTAALAKAGVEVAKATEAIDGGTATIVTGAIKAGQILGSDLSDKEKAREVRQQAENTTAAYFTAGLSSLAQTADAKLLGGRGEKLRDKLDAANPLHTFADKVTGKVIGAVSGGKNKDQQGRDQIRKLGTESGLINKEDWTVTLSDGSTGDMGKDGGGGQHQFRDSSQVVDEVRDLSAYDVDYTNDLDFSSNMMTNALMRMVTGGKGTSIDQVAGQLGNAALGKVGFGQDMTEENFNYVRDNVRGFYFKQGIQTKEDAYALSNQMVAEGRITEMDVMAMQQGINMAFDDNGFDAAQVLMSGRRKGLEVAADIPSSPGPNFQHRPVAGPDFQHRPIATNPTDGTMVIPEASEVMAYGLEMNPGTYGGNSNTDIFTRSIIKYQDSWSKRNATS